MPLAPRQTPDQPRIHRSEHQFPLLGPFARTGHVVQNPLDLRRTEIGIDDQSRLLADHVRRTLILQFVAIVRSSPVLPHDRIINRFLRLGIPHNGGFTLVGDTDTGNIQPIDIHHRNGLRNDGCLRRPDLVRIVFHPSRLRKNLPKLLLGHYACRSFFIENNGPRAARPLIECKNILFHNRLEFSLYFLS